MRHVWSISKREFAGYFATPVAAVFLVIFLVLTSVFTFKLGGFYERGQADLRPFFNFIPWLYLFLMPAMAMRLWAEERRLGTVEVLMTLPISVGEAVAGKFLAAWLFSGLALLLTFPIWITVNYLGDPDNGAIFAGYLGSFLMAGGFLAIGACISALTKSQVIAFVLSVVICLGFILSGLPMVQDFFEGWAPQALLDTLSYFSFLTHFDSFSKGVVGLDGMVFFGSLIAFFLFLNTLVLDWRKAA